jgi:uncharacterized protein (DUF983 family)
MKVGVLKSLVKQRCPKCGNGRMFITSMFNLKQFHKMNEKCNSCGQDFLLEPGFYMGAMYISYGFQVAIVIASMVSVSIFNPELSFKFHLMIVGALILCLFTLIFRLSRSIWIHICIQNDKKT